MYNIEYVTQNIEQFIKLMLVRKMSEIEVLELSLLPKINELRKKSITECQEFEQKNNHINSKIIPNLKKSQEDISSYVTEVQANNLSIKKLQNIINECDQKIKSLLENCPNLPMIDGDFNSLIPCGGEENNFCVAQSGEIRNFNFTPLAHDVIGETLKMMDFKQTAKISGARFVTLFGKIAKLEQALINFMLDMHINHHGYELVSPPYLVREQAMYGVGQLPKFSEESFMADSGPVYGQSKNIAAHESYRLIPTAEACLTNLVRERIIPEAELPLRYVAITPCFRSEIGSAGRDVTGIIRMHQFMKVELVSIVKADEEQKISIDRPDSALSLDQIDCEHERMTRCAITILEKLGLSYRLLLLANGDMGFSARKTYDLEVWMPAQNKYREISSCSYCGDFQGRRMNSRYKDSEGKNQFIHSLNGSALAIGRTIAAIIENYQTENGDFEIPEILKRYMM